MTSTRAKSASKPRSKPVEATVKKEKRPLEVDKQKSVQDDNDPQKSVTSASKSVSKPKSKRPMEVDKQKSVEDDNDPQKSVISASKSVSKPKSKRPMEVDKQKIVSSKKPRKEDKEEKEKKEEKETEERLSKKQAVVPFQKVFSDEDEIVILKGMIDYKQKKGVDAMTDLDDFCGFIKTLLASDYGKRQVIDKVRRFRKKFNKVNKKVTTEHDKKILELCEEIWKKDQSVGNLSEMWDRVSLAQMEVDQMRYKVLKEEQKRILEALKSANQ